MMKTTVITLTISSTTNCLARTNVPMRTASIAVVSTVRIIVPFGTFMARLTDINQRRNTIIQGLVIMAIATGVIDSVSDWGSLAPQSENPCNPALRPGTTKGIGMSRNTMTIGTLAVLAISLLATSASAHPTLTSASPAADVSSKVSPTEIRLNFSESVIAKFSGLELKDEAGKAIATGVPVNDPKDRKQLVVPVPSPLMAGHYQA